MSDMITIFWIYCSNEKDWVNDKEIYYTDKGVCDDIKVIDFDPNWGPKYELVEMIYDETHSNKYSIF